MKRSKQIFSILLAVVMLTLSIPLTTFYVSAYNVSSAVSYANDHWNDGQGLCAEFVARCLDAGGVSIPNESYYDWDQKSYQNNSGELGKYTNPFIASAAQLLWFSDQGYQIIANPSDSEFSLGDVAFMPNTNGSRDGHVGIITKVENGHPYYSAHNNARDRARLYGCTYLVKMDGSTNPDKARIDINPQGGSAQDSFYVNFGEKCNLTTDSAWKPGYALAGWNLYRPADEKWYCSDEGWCTSSEISANGYKKKLYSSNLSMTLDSSWYSSCSTSVSVFTFFAVWKDATYTITINANGGTASTSSLSVKYNAKCNLSPSYVNRYGYKLVGWNLYRPADEKWFVGGVGWCTGSEISANGYKKSQYSPNLSMTLDNSWFGKCYESVSMFTFFAVWEPDAYTININANGGTATTTSLSVTYGAKCNLSSGFVQRTGYKLQGWNLYRPADGKWWASGEGWCTASQISANGYTKKVYSTNLSMTLDDSWFKNCSASVSSFTFYAVWTSCTHTWNSGTVTKASTCVATGIKTFTCTSCSATKTETIPVNASNHVNTKNVAATASTCTVKGYSAGVYCNDCKKYISGHTEQPLANHQTTLINAREATYDANGYTGDTYCTVCRQTLSYGSSIPKLTKPNEPTNPTNPTQPTNPTNPTQPTAQQQQQQSGGCKYCGQTHSGFPGVLIGFFHSILAMFGLRK